MPRKRRIVVPNLPHHVTQRGNYRNNVFDSTKDYQQYTYWASHYVQKYSVKVLAYCLMPNHVHFIVTPKDENGLSRLFSTLHMRYSQYKNERKGEKGHFWEARFYSCVLSPTHLDRALRYVEMNPVRAHLSRRPWDYTWSSCRQHIGLEKSPIITTIHQGHLLQEIGKQTKWRHYLLEEDEAIHKEIQIQTKKGLALGSKDFIINLEQKINCVLRPQKPGRRNKGQRPINTNN